MSGDMWNFQLELFKNGLPRGIVSGSLQLSQTAELPEDIAAAAAAAEGAANGGSDAVKEQREEDSESLGRTYSRFRRGTSVYKSRILLDEDEEGAEREAVDAAACREDEDGEESVANTPRNLSLRGRFKGAEASTPLLLRVMSTYGDGGEEDLRDLEETVPQPLLNGLLSPPSTVLLAVHDSGCSSSSGVSTEDEELTQADGAGTSASASAAPEGGMYPFFPSGRGASAYITISTSPKYRERLRSIRRRPRRSKEDVPVPSVSLDDSLTAAATAAAGGMPENEDEEEMEEREEAEEAGGKQKSGGVEGTAAPVALLLVEKRSFGETPLESERIGTEPASAPVTPRRARWETTV